MRSAWLYEFDPKELPDADLNDLYKGLVAKLAMAADEMIGRGERLVAESSGHLAAWDAEGLQSGERRSLRQDLQRQQANVSRLKRFQFLIRQELKTLKAKIEQDREAERAKVGIAAQS